MNEEIAVIYKEQVKKIKLFDVLVKDIHKRSDTYQVLEGSSALSYHEVWEWISQGGDWDFIVTEHDNSKNIFLRGTTIQNMDSARKGEEELVLGFANEKELYEIDENLKKKYR
jgi:hypothetical protein